MWYVKNIANPDCCTLGVHHEYRESLAKLYVA